jgi:hypothetical protein
MPDVSDQIRCGQIAMTGAAVQLAAIPKSVQTVMLKNHKANVGTMWVGSDNTVSNTTGFEFSPGDTLSLDLLNPGRIWVIGTAAEKLSWMTVKAG